ncbi:MAG TPA: hypothetical protein VJZ71_17540 [Phycisphaerae bacterium]|nr:hypothetical protein [Phycisphaerae bacterium]
MSWQQHVGVKATPVQSHKGASREELEDWRIADFTVGYVDTEAVLSGQLRIFHGATNLTPDDITLHFETAQKIRICIMDAAGNVAYETPLDQVPQPNDQLIASTEGTYWLETVGLDPAVFQANQPYVIRAMLRATNLPAMASVPLSIRPQGGKI